jgi:hypothetical protein
MSALVLESDATLHELVEHLRQSPAALQATLRLLIEGICRRDNRPGPVISCQTATAKGRTAFFDHVDWLKRRIDDRE